jgi:hypothetical protein
MENLKTSLPIKLYPFGDKLSFVRIVFESLQKLMVLLLILRHYAFVDQIFHCVHHLNCTHHIFPSRLFLVLYFLYQPQNLNRTVVFNFSTVFGLHENLPHSNSASVEFLPFVNDYLLEIILTEAYNFEFIPSIFEFELLLRQQTVCVLVPLDVLR